MVDSTCEHCAKIVLGRSELRYRKCVRGTLVLPKPDPQELTKACRFLENERHIAGTRLVAGQRRPMVSAISRARSTGGRTEYEDDHQEQPRRSRRRWGRSDSVGLTVIVVIVAVLIGLGASHSSNSSGGSTGSAQSGVTAYGQPLTFQLSSFDDQATDGSGYGCDSACDNHYAIAHLSATNEGTATLQSYLPVTFTAFGSNGGTYQSSQYAEQRRHALRLWVKPTV